jgi:hypothetical protein
VQAGASPADVMRRCVCCTVPLLFHFDELKVRRSVY